MRPSWFRRIPRRLVPPIAWRDDKLAERREEVRSLSRELRHVTRERDRAIAAAESEQLQDRIRELDGEVRALRSSSQRSSFQRSLDDLRRTVLLLRAIDESKAHPLRQLPFKLRNYRLAASHGIPVPMVHATWNTIDDIDLAMLPDEFVVKSDGGAGGHGVLPLRRRDTDHYQLISTNTVLTAEDVRGRLRTRRSLSAPFFAEELLRSPGGSTIPEDVKIFAFYGEIGQVLLRRVHEHANLQRTHYRFVDEHGTDLGDGVSDRRLDPTIQPPAQLRTMVETARHLSRAVGVPFVRVDLYESDRGIVLGELTRGPGGNPTYSTAHDEFMGRLYEEARWRLERDIMRGRPPGLLHGLNDAPNPYPADHLSQQDDPGTWAVAPTACDQCRDQR